MKTYNTSGHIDAQGRLTVEVQTELPESDADVLIVVQPVNGSGSAALARKRFAGSWGKAVRIAENFDEPLEDFREYMQ